MDPPRHRRCSARDPAASARDAHLSERVLPLEPPPQGRPRIQDHRREADNFDIDRAVGASFRSPPTLSDREREVVASAQLRLSERVV